jgi:hypothetical protein
MGMFRHKVSLPAAYHKKLLEADRQQEKAKEELVKAKSLAKEVAEIRQDNHFAQDWRKALGIKDGR